MTEFFVSIVWLILALLVLLPLQDWVTGRLAAILLRFARNPRTALALYFALFFPGVLLHEGSHWLTALLLGARPGRPSLGAQRLTMKPTLRA